MERMGTKFVIPAVLTASGDFALLETYKSIRTTDRIHVSLTTGLAGNLFSRPGIKVKGGMLEPLTGYSVQPAVTSRAPIYFSINNTMCAVEVKGNYILSDGEWSEDTVVTFYSIVDSISLNGKLYTVFEPDSGYNGVSVSSFSLDGFSYMNFPQPVTYGHAVLKVLAGHIEDKVSYYQSRVGGV